MRYHLRLQEFNYSGKKVRDVSIFKTNKFDRAVSRFHEKVQVLSEYGSSTGRLLLMDNEEVIKEYNH